MKNTQRCLALILSVLLLLSTIPVSVFALETKTVLFEGGDGTENNPYQISTPEQLNAVRNDLSACYIQINDIDLSTWENWEPIGTNNSSFGMSPFVGTYNGNGYMINNLTIDSSENTDYIGLFGNASSAIIKNIRLNNANISVSQADYVGSIAACGTIENCYVSAEIQANSGCFGGVVGKGSASNCSFWGNIENNSSIGSENSTYGITGGIIGSGTADMCCNQGTISATTTTASFTCTTGGVVGMGSATESCNFGEITSKSMNSNSSSYCGGIVGFRNGTLIRDCFNVGKLSSSSSKWSAMVGGICGYSVGGSIANSYNIGELNCNSYYTYVGKYQGGIIGLADSQYVNISNCYYVNDVSNVAGSGNVSSKVSCNNTIAMEESKFCIQNSFSGFDFETVWTFDTDSEYFYPILRSINKDTGNSETITPGNTIKQWYFEEPIVIIDVGEAKALSVHSRDVANVNGELVYSNDTIVNSTDIDWNAELYEDSGIIKIDDNGQIIGLSEGYEHILINSKNDLNLSTFCCVYVGDPNALHYTSTYDTKQYYADGGFYSEVSSISDCVEIYILLENKLKEAVANISGIDETIAKDTEKETFKDIKPITLTASVNGTGLSFDRDTYQNTYTVTLDSISIAQAVDDILMLFPHNLNVASSGNNYTVTVTLESESFETITDEYSFTVENLETKSANEHIDFISSNKDYKVSKQNIYGETMVTLKNDAEYKWSKYSTFDFENYYEVVFADILIELMNTSQLGHVSLLPVVKEWVGNYKTILSEVSTIVEDDYTGHLNVTENAIDKVLKKSKYTTEGMDVHDEFRDLVVLKLRDKVSIDKVNSAFAAIDKTQQYFSFFELSVDITNDIADFIDGVSVLNAYKEMDDEFKAIIQNLYNQIPSSEKKLKDAVYHYVNVDSYWGYSSEILNEVRNMAGDITLDVFNTVYKKQVLSSICKSIGNIQLKSGTLFSSTAAFSGISTAIGSFTTGVQLGLCISDILCDSSGKSEEMSKVVAMSEFSPYVINTLNHYESKLYIDRNDAAVTYYEYAFAMHKATQRYIMQHTVNSLETKRDSLIIKLFGRDDYDGLISDILAQKRPIDNLECHNTNPSSSVVTETKVIAIKCPVDVFVHDEYGNLVVEIRNNTLVYCADEIEVCISESEKYICVPAENEYEVKIVSTGEGAMNYIVFEYDKNSELESKKKIDSIPLSIGKEFIGTIYKTDRTGSQNHVYSLISGTEEYFTQEDNCKIEGHTTSIINYEASSCTMSGYSGDVYCEDCKKTIDYGEVILANGHSYSETVVSPTCTEDGYILHCCSSCGDTYKDNYTKKLGHNMSEFDFVIESSCSEEGIEQSVCSRCSYKETRTVEKLEHTNTDGDSLCDNCEYDVTVACEHICHSDNWFLSFIWKIVVFFNRIFGNNRYCGCGMAHY